MRAVRRAALVLSLLLAVSFPVPAAWGRGAAPPSQAGQQPLAPGQVIRRIGTIKAINAKTITLVPDNGAPVDAAVQDSTSVVRIPPGETNLKNGTPAQFQDLQPGDRIYVAGRLADDGKTISALTIVLTKQSDLTAKQAQDREDWQKRGVAGVIDRVDAASGTILFSAGKNKSAIHATKSTVIRRYSPDSAQMENARRAPLSEAKPGDQIQARGARSADGAQLEADEIVFGTFRNISATVISGDTAAQTLMVLDLATKKPLLVRVTAESQLHKLLPQMAQGAAARLKAGAGMVGAKDASGAPDKGTASFKGASSGETAGASPMGGAPDLQRVILRSPPVTIGDLQKGDALMILSTEGTDAGGVTAIVLAAGVEPILQASPKGGQGMVLSPWSLSGGGGDAESQ